MTAHLQDGLCCVPEQHGQPKYSTGLDLLTWFSVYQPHESGFTWNPSPFENHLDLCGQVARGLATLINHAACCTNLAGFCALPGNSTPITRVLETFYERGCRVLSRVSQEEVLTLKHPKFSARGDGRGWAMIKDVLRPEDILPLKEFVSLLTEQGDRCAAIICVLNVSTVHELRLDRTSIVSIINFAAT